MDYDLHLGTLSDQESNFSGLKSSADSLVNDCNDLASTISNSNEISGLESSLTDASSKIENGYKSCNEWMNGYNTDINNTENDLANFEGPILNADFSNIFTKILVPALKNDATKEAKDNISKLGNIHTGYEGEKYFQWMTELNSCGLNAFIMGVNTLLGEQRYFSNGEEYAKFDYNTTTIGWGNDNRAQQWINSSGLSNQIRVTGVENVHSKEELYEHLNNGEVVIASAQAYTDAEQIFKRKNGDYVNAPNGHYIMFYKNEDGVCYANDGGWRVPGGGFLSQTSEVEADNRTAIPYTPEDLDRFFSTGGNGSLTVGKV